MEKKTIEEIYSLFDFDEKTMDRRLKLFSISSQVKDCKSNFKEMTNIFACLINTKHILFEDCNWWITENEKSFGSQIIALLKKILDLNNQSIFSSAQIYGFNKSITELGNETSFKDNDSIKNFYKKMLFNSRINYCDVQKNLSLFFNKISSVIESKFKINEDKIFLRLLLLTGYNDNSIDVNLFKSILQSFVSSNIIINLNFVFLENDYFNNNFLKPEIINFLEFKQELNPSTNSEIIDHLISSYGPESIEDKFQKASKEYFRIYQTSFGNESVIKYLESFEKKMNNLIDMNDLINGFIKDLDAKENGSENLEKIVNDKLLEKIFINIYEFLKTEGSNLNKIIDEALLKLEESINFAKERKEEINKKNLSCYYWDQKIVSIENQLNSIITLGKKIRNLDNYVRLLQKIINERIDKRLRSI